ncbi:ribulokinase [Spirochaetia bacterium]|nr:ribulokinase [Spirochaetia bacterium]
MGLQKGEAYVLGLDYGTDSCRVVIIDAACGKELASAVTNYPRWAKGLYSNPAANQFRQHPLDYIETLEQTVRDALGKAGPEAAAKIRSIAIDTTGSTPCAVDRTAQPLSLKSEFAENPSAMFVLWKDHTGGAEAGRINDLAKSWGGVDYTRFQGGTYSPECFWAKVMRVLSEDSGVAAAAYSFLEHCDWMAAMLTGSADVLSIKRSRCVMGHKAMWHGTFAGKSPSEFAGGKLHTNEGGYPSDEFLSHLDPRLVKIRETLGNKTYTSDTVSGLLTREWAARLGLPALIPVAVGGVDAHVGGVGGGVRPGRMVMVVGTSTCDMIVGPKPLGEERPIRGICGQVDGSIVPGMIGYEAGQSAFGDAYAWFRQLLLWPLENILPGIEVEGIDQAAKEKLIRAIAKKILPELEKAADKIDPVDSGLAALDWLNGRRSPDADLLVKGAIVGLGLGSSAPRIFRALVEATAFGARAITERFREEGVPIESIAAVGGIAGKSSFVMQTIADVLKMPIEVAAGDQSVALGAAMFAAVAAGLYPDIPSAQKAMGAPIEKIYRPNAERAKIYDGIYERYKRLGEFVETLTK